MFETSGRKCGNMTGMQQQQPLQQFILQQLFQSHCPLLGSWQAYLNVHERAGTVLSM